MRAPAIVVAVAAAVALSGCMETNTVDGEGSGGGADPEVAFFLLGAALIAGIVLVAINLSNPGGSPPSPPLVPGRPPQPAEQPGWQQVEEFEAEAPSRAAPKQARRRAP